MSKAIKGSIWVRLEPKDEENSAVIKPFPYYELVNYKGKKLK